MLKTVITADSGVVIHAEGIKTIPLVVINSITGESYLDQEEIDNNEVYRLRNEGYKLSTSCMNPFDMKDFFLKTLEDADQIVHLCMSDLVSKGSFQVPHMAANEVAPERITVINTKQGGSGGLLVAKKACGIVKESHSLEEIKQYLENDIIENVVTSFIVPDPSGYQRSGKGAINKFLNMGIKMLSAGSGYPLIKLKNGALKPYGTLRVKDANKYIAFFKDCIDPNKMAENEIAVAYTMGSSAYEEFSRFMEETDITVTASQMSAVIASYACKDTFGISYIKSK